MRISRTARKGACLPKWNFYFGIASPRGCIHGRKNRFNVATQRRLLLIADNHKRDFPIFQVLLIAHVFVGGEQNVKACRLRHRYQFTVRKSVPPTFDGFNNGVTFEAVAKRCGSAVIEKYEHRPVGRVVARAAERQGFALQIRSQQLPVHGTNGTTR